MVPIKSLNLLSHPEPLEYNFFEQEREEQSFGRSTAKFPALKCGSLPERDISVAHRTSSEAPAARLQSLNSFVACRRLSEMPSLVLSPRLLNAELERSQ